MLFSELPDILTVKDIQNYLRISRSAAYEMVNKSGFPKITINRNTIRAKKTMFAAWLDQQAGLACEGSNNNVDPAGGPQGGYNHAGI